MAVRMTKTARFIAFAASLALVSCRTPADPAADVSDPYASNFNDGFYNPYPGQGGTMQPGASPPAYQRPPVSADAPPEPAADPYAFGAGAKPSAGSSKPKTIASSGSSKKSTSSSKSKSKSKSKSSSGSRYTVSKGDTLYGIALRKKTTVAKLKAANGLKSDLIRPGQSLKIP